MKNLIIKLLLNILVLLKVLRKANFKGTTFYVLDIIIPSGSFATVRVFNFKNNFNINLTY